MATLFNTKIKDTYQSLLKLEDNTILTTTSKNITDGLGNASPLYMSTTRIGIGTNAPANTLSVVGADSVNNLGVYGASGRLQIRGYLSATYGTLFESTTSGGALMPTTISASKILLLDGQVGINTTSTGAQLHIKGSGSTSATTSLLVQNSAAQQSMSVLDDGSCTIGINGSTTNSLTIVGNSGIQAIIGNNHFQSPANIFRYGGGTITFFGNNNDGTAFSFGFNNNQASTSTTSAMIGLGGNYQSQQSFQFANLRINPTYDFNANTTTNAIARGIYYNPTLTNLRVAQHRAIETVTGDVLFGTTSGKATFGSGLAGTSYIEIKPGISNGFNRITFNDFDGGTATRGGFIEISTYLAQINFGSYNSFYLGNSSKPYNLYMVAGTSNIIISTGNIVPTDSGALFQVKGTGSTSATTSLLVQNSSGNNTLQVKDNGDLWVGTTASGLGKIYVPHDSSYGDRVFLQIQNGSNLLSTRSNALLLINGSSFWAPDLALTSENQGFYGKTAAQTSSSSVRLSTAVNAYNGTSQNDACNLLYIQNRDITLQAAGSVNWIKMDGNVFEAGGGGNKWCTGIYYNPTFTGGTLLANSHYCYHSTSGQMMVNTTSPQASAQLQVDSTTRGVLFPRMTTAQKLAIVSPVGGLQVFDTTLNQMSYYNGSAWINF